MTPDPSPELRARIENTIRFLAVDAVEAANSGHPGAPMGLACAALELWDRHLRFDPSDPGWPLRDRFVLSNGHASMLQYALLHLFGFEAMTLEQIQRFRQLHSITPGHPEYGDTPGIEVTTGPLGQGFGHAVGMGLAGRMTRARYGAGGEGPGHHTDYAIVSDGAHMEGISHEAASFAGSHRLGNLVFLYDDNEITIDGPTSLTFHEDVRKRFDAMGWHVSQADGGDAGALRSALETARAEMDRPSLIVVRTTIGLGSPNKGGTSGVHGSPLGADERRLTKERAGWPLEPEFLVPDDVRDYLNARIAEKRKAREEDDARLARWREAHPEKAQAWDAARERRLPEDLAERLCQGLEDKSDATRKHGGAALNRLVEAAPYFVGGSADLAGSAAPAIVKSAGTVGPGAGDGADPFAGTNLHFGVREHGMAAITNGINLDGTLRGYCGTFLIFSDYMRPSIRLAALMGVPTSFVFTHDSIYLGEDGPTHQPVEQLDALRAIPNLTVFRPADGIETAMAFAWMAKHTGGPALLALTRQGLPALERRVPFEREDVWKGAYAVSDPGPDARVVLLGTGSEVSLACDAARLLEARGLPARVVSMPSVELFLEQPERYRHGLLPPDGPPVVALEVGRGESLRRFAGHRGLVYGIDGFGASAPYETLAEHFGFTPEQVAERVAEHLRSLEG